MAGREPAGRLARLVHERGAGVAGVEGVGLAVAADHHLIGLFLPPLDRPFGAVDFDEQVVLAAVADLAGRDGAQGAVFEADRGMAVVVELATGLENLQVATDRFGEQAGHVAGQIVGVRADVAEAAGRAAAGRIGSPGGLLLVFAFQPRPQPALHIEDADGVDFAQLAAEDHLARLPHQGIAGVVVGDGETPRPRRRPRRPGVRPGPGRASSACRK